MILLTSNDGNEWSLDFGPDSVTLIVIYLVQKLTIKSQKKPLAAWSLMFSGTQDVLNNNLAPVSITPDQQRTMGMGNDVFSSVGAQDVDAYQVSDLEDIEFQWEDPDLNMDALLRPNIDTPLLLQLLILRRVQ